MTLVFYAASGSPYVWRVWLALEQRRIPFELRMLSFDRGDLKTPEFAAVNPRRRVPAIEHDGFALYESAAIVEYLDEIDAPGPRLFPADLRQRAIVRRMVREADQYFAEALEALVAQLLFTPQTQWSEAAIAHARGTLVDELARWEQAIIGDFLAGALSAADLTLFPELALALRIAKRKPGLDLDAALGPRLNAWRDRMQALDIVQRTWPPHWQAPNLAS